MPYNSLIDRSEVDVFLPEEVATETLAVAVQQSAALSLCRQVPMITGQKTMPVLSALPLSYWVNGDTGLKQTTESAWTGATLVAEELAAILPIPDVLLEDMDRDIWTDLRPLLAEAIAVRLDEAVFGGVGRPTSWPLSLVEGARAATNVEMIDATAADGGIYGDIELAMGQVEDDGYVPSGIAARPDFKRKLRRARSTTGELLGEVNTASAWGLPIEYFIAPSAVPTTVHAVVGDYSLAVIGVRRDVTYKLLDQAVITDATGAIIYNLPQQDMQAMRVTARFGFQVGKPATRTGAANAYPFATLETAA